ncbi:multidrug efflux pump subunit AcrA (membrane-fusion protein) [Rhodoblastus acidophilus]|uniref:hypothetical protein n=1 Tax=Rhodoblastus acidophilus TaxID=1074 RepID=UPI002224B479|nr:hypothetical protein [Rhodoblastus acidophilus]MCW2283986.1 multidrug efflux pump subunit AcrA (membrane-fusion protein) [Rhodoblastus acidophilus]MCW2332682.1 multidrug efflux pump subunit AcrA (membrane-fusion protein) [Rhodoblastus acidophilus]
MTKFRSKRIADQHPLFAGDGAKLAFGKRWDGHLVSIAEVESGATCGCYCPDPACARPLWAKKGDELIHHFAHAPLSADEKRRGVIPVCTNGGKTGLHIFAQELLDREKRLVIPPFGVRIGDREKQRTPKIDYVFDRAVLEKMDGETIPDVILYSGDQRLHVEILVTHKCDDVKIAKLKKINISAIEINLSGLRQRQDSRALDVEALSNAILREEPREWLHNRHERDALDELQAEIEAEAKAALERRQQAADELRREYERAAIRAVGAKTAGADNKGELSQPDPVIDQSTGGEGFFAVHPQVWKTQVVLLLRNGTTVAGVTADFHNRRWINVAFTPARTDGGALLAEAGLPKSGAAAAITDFLRHLAALNIAEDRDGQWRFTEKQIIIIRERKLERERAKQEQEACQQRHTELADLVQAILRSASASDRIAFSHASWRDTSVANLGAPATLADAGGMDWDVLRAELKKTLAVLEGRRDPPCDCLGLPVEEQLAAIHQAHVAKLDEQRQAREEAERIAAELRVAELRRFLGLYLNDFSAWTEEPNVALDGLSPLQAAERAPEHLRRAEALAGEKISEAQAQQARIDRLNAESKILFPDDFQASLALKTGGWGLPGNARPIDYVRDDATLFECLEKLRSRFKARARR